MGKQSMKLECLLEAAQPHGHVGFGPTRITSTMCYVHSYSPVGSHLEVRMKIHENTGLLIMFMFGTP